MQFEKFPFLKINSSFLVWDTRQELNDVETIYIDSRFQTAEVIKKLKNRESKKSFKYSFDELAVDSSLAVGNPSEKLKIYGITGTNGKTSTVAIASYLLSKIKPTKILSIGTLGGQVWQDGKIIEKFNIGYTTPLAPQLQYILSGCLKNEITDVVMEVSSHSIVESRILACQFDACGFTNISIDHLDYHLNFEDYFNAKKQLFLKYPQNQSKSMIKVVSEEFFNNFNKVKDIEKSISLQLLSQSFQGIKYNFQDKQFNLPLVGSFQLQNLSIAASLINKVQNIDFNTLLSMASDFTGIPGRMEKVENYKKLNIFIDYSHTPDSLKNALTTIKDNLSSAGKLYLIFGCGGERDKIKRPLMGKVAVSIADKVLVTNDNPRNEDPNLIVKDITSGVLDKYQNKVLIELCRKTAIEGMIDKLSVNDVLLIAGKGHENYQVIKDKTIEFSDYNFASKYINNT